MQKSRERGWPSRAGAGLTVAGRKQILESSGGTLLTYIVYIALYYKMFDFLYYKMFDLSVRVCYGKPCLNVTLVV